jgi:predicted MFS family arabinose efflux permease
MTDFVNKNEGKLTQNLLWVLSIGASFVVANLYYSQPLLGILAKEFNVSESDVSKIPMITQLGYAAGIILIVPLGDILERKRLVLIEFCAMIVSMIGVILSPNLITLIIASFFVGITSVMPQIFVPITVLLSEPSKMTKNVSVLVSVVLIGILLSRVYSGLIGNALNWRAVYIIATCVLVVFSFLLAKMLPKIEPTFNGSYKELMLSIAHYARDLKELRIAAIRGALSFASFSIFWTMLVFRLQQAPFFAGSNIAGLLGLVGVSGALAANLVGRILHRINPLSVITVGIVSILISWLIMGFFDNSYLGLILGIVFLDMGSQSINISNQSIIFASNKHATSRINAVYIGSFFLGGSLGTYLGGMSWQISEWHSVVIVGFAITSVNLILHLVSSYGKKTTKK